MSDTAAGFQEPRTTGSEYAAHEFMIRNILNKAWVMTMVKVISCTNSGGLAPVGFVDVQPLVNQVDGNGQPVPHDVIHHLPYLRMVGGKNAVIMDPEPNDIGVCMFAHHDLSNIKANGGKQANPGSSRRNSPADGVFMNGWNTGVTPTQYIMMNSTDGIKLVSPIKVQIVAPEADITATGAINLTSSTLKHNGVDISEHHKHTQVQTGGGQSGPPVGGT